MPDNESSRCFVSPSLYLWLLLSHLFLLTGYSDVHPPGRVATRLRRCLGFAWLIMNLSSSVSLKPSGAVTPSWIVFTALRGTDSLPTVLCVGGWRVVVRMGLCLKDESTAGTDMTCQILLIKFLDVSAVLRACCASVHSFLVWVAERAEAEALMIAGEQPDALPGAPEDAALLGDVLPATEPAGMTLTVFEWVKRFSISRRCLDYAGKLGILNPNIPKSMYRVLSQVTPSAETLLSIVEHTKTVPGAARSEGKFYTLSLVRQLKNLMSIPEWARAVCWDPVHTFPRPNDVPLGNIASVFDARYAREHPLLADPTKHVLGLQLLADGGQPYSFAKKDILLGAIVVANESTNVLLVLVAPDMKEDPSFHDKYFLPLHAEFVQLGEGIQVYDAHQNKNILLQAVLLPSAFDYEECGSLLGAQGTSATLPCFHCCTRKNGDTWHSCVAQQPAGQFQGRCLWADAARIAFGEDHLYARKAETSFFWYRPLGAGTKRIGRANVYLQLVRIRGDTTTVLFECVRVIKMQVMAPGSQTFGVYRTARYTTKSNCYVPLTSLCSCVTSCPPWKRGAAAVHEEVEEEGLDEDREVAPKGVGFVILS
ncbi:hypothetical protein PAPYR_11409 [Paratrimastix pyriformis]|uniref:Uncharacterized protein n=1 Tax=Paratrimastix pyriformis TaxID=342808 RepID=A0ABQ8U3Q9_9EUKA|nr:hypothetical protein PAPYR_11409 [Paratrimastix pyriformis]